MLNQEEWEEGELSKASQDLLPFQRMALTQKGDSQKMTESRGTAVKSKSSARTHENNVERKQAWLN